MKTAFKGPIYTIERLVIAECPSWHIRLVLPLDLSEQDVEQALENICRAIRRDWREENKGPFLDD